MHSNQVNPSHIQDYYSMIFQLDSTQFCDYLNFIVEVVSFMTFALIFMRIFGVENLNGFSIVNLKILGCTWETKIEGTYPTSVLKIQKIPNFLHQNRSQKPFTTKLEKSTNIFLNKISV